MTVGFNILVRIQNQTNGSILKLALKQQSIIVIKKRVSVRNTTANGQVLQQHNKSCLLSLIIDIDVSEIAYTIKAFYKILQNAELRFVNVYFPKNRI